MSGYVLIVSRKGPHVKRNENAVLVPGGAPVTVKRLSVSGREVAALVGVAALLVPLLMGTAGVFSLPSLVERGVESLIPGVADGTSHMQPSAPPSRFGALAAAALNSAVALPATRDRASRGSLSVASDKARRVTSSRGSRAARVSVPGVPQAPAPGVTGPFPTDDSPPPTQGQSGGSGGSGGSGPGNPGPVDSGTPAVAVGVNGSTATLSVDTGGSPVTGTASVSASPSSVSAAAAVAGVSNGTGATVPPDAGEVAVPAVTATVESVAASALTGLTPA
jgi:hypothetical protein